MSKIPVGATIAQAYGFAFGNFFPILRLIWVSWALPSAAGYQLFVHLHYVLDLWLRYAIVVAFYVLMLFFVAMQAVAVSKRSLGLRTTAAYVYLTFEPAVWRLSLALVTVAGLFATVLAVILVVFVQVGRNPEIVDDYRIAIGISAGIFIAFAALIYVLVRASFFLAPACVAEQGFGLSRSWRLGRSNFWRAFVVTTCVFAPVAAAIGLYEYFFVFRDFPGLQSEQGSAAVAAWRGSLTARINQEWYLVYPASLVIEIFFVGLTFGAQCFAYRALVPAATEAEAFT